MTLLLTFITAAFFILFGGYFAALNYFHRRMELRLRATDEKYDHMLHRGTAAEIRAFVAMREEMWSDFDLLQNRTWSPLHWVRTWNKDYTAR